MAANKPSVMGGLREAINWLLVESFEIEGNGVKHLEGYYAIPIETLDNLKKEYIIHFIEPDDDTDFKEWQNEND